MSRPDKIRVALFFILVPIVIYAVAVLSGCAAGRQPATPKMSESTASASSLADAVLGFSKLFIDLGPYVDGAGASLYKHGKEVAEAIVEKARSHEFTLWQANREVDEMKRWGLEQEKLKDAAITDPWYVAGYKVRWYWKGIRRSLIALLLIGAIGSLAARVFPLNPVAMILGKVAAAIWHAASWGLTTAMSKARRST